MKKCLLIVTAIFYFTTIVTAQTTRTLKKFMQIIMPRTIDDSMPGTNGAAVVWHPVQKKYYATMAGNMAYPMGVYDAAGKRLSSESLSSKIDVRGLWYNPTTKNICGNGYADNGWFHYVLEPKGAVKEMVVDADEMLQPTDQSVGTFVTGKNQIMFLNGNQVTFYTDKGSEATSIGLRLGITKKDDIGETFEWDTDVPEAYNYSTAIFTGIKNAELGILNLEKNQIELYEMEKGFLTSTLNIPEEVTIYPAFNYSYTNSMYWFFNKDTRTWTAYK